MLAQLPSRMRSIEEPDTDGAALWQMGCRKTGLCRCEVAQDCIGM